MCDNLQMALKNNSHKMPQLQKRNILSSCLNSPSLTSSWRSWAGRPFHKLGPTALNYLSPKCECMRGTKQVSVSLCSIIWYWPKGVECGYSDAGKVESCDSLQLSLLASRWLPRDLDHLWLQCSYWVQDYRYLIRMHVSSSVVCVLCCRLVLWHVAQPKHSSSTSIVVFIHLACRSLAILKCRLKVS